MEIKYITINHPSINNRKITYLLIDNKIDLDSARFLNHEAHNGGRHGSISGKSTHKKRAIKIGELYRHLDDMGLTWRNSLEIHIKQIRNAMLCWDINNIKDYGKYDYQPIQNDTMNQKLSVWYKFYVYMKYRGEEFNMILSTKRVKKKYYQNNMLNHLNKQESQGFIDVWSLYVKPSPEKYTYKVITKIEFSKFFNYLYEIDIIYAMMAYIAVETGLRIDALLNLKYEQFNNLFKYWKSGKSLQDSVKIEYFDKSSEDNLKYTDIRLEVIFNLKKYYLQREYLSRLRLNKKNKFEQSLWLKKNGDTVKYHNIRKAFVEVSDKLGYANKKVTPHWMRHCCVTWALIDFSKSNNLPLEYTGITPNQMFINLLSKRIGHTTIDTIKKYIQSALDLMKMGLHSGSVIVTLSSLESNEKVQSLVKEEAKKEFGKEFKDSKFNLVQYAIKRKICFK